MLLSVTLACAASLTLPSGLRAPRVAGLPRAVSAALPRRAVISLRLEEAPVKTPPNAAAPAAKKKRKRRPKPTAAGDPQSGEQ